MNLKLNDLKPQEAEFTLSTKPESKLTLKRFSLAQRIWVTNRFGSDNIKGIFEDQRISDMAEIAYHLIKEKDAFPNFEAFCEAVVTVEDQLALTKALLKTIGIDDAMFKKIAAEEEKKDAQNPNGQSPNPESIGAPSMTSSPVSTDTQSTNS